MSKPGISYVFYPHVTVVVNNMRENVHASFIQLRLIMPAIASGRGFRVAAIMNIGFCELTIMLDRNSSCGTVVPSF